MKSNPGGHIAPENIFGRDSVIDKIWDVLDGQSIYMNAERRIGKSSILTKLDAEPRSGWWPAKRDLEDIHTSAEFAGAVYKDVARFLGHKQRAARLFKEFVEDIGGIEVGGVFKLPNGNPAPWKTVIKKSIHDLNDACRDSGERLVFLWDEVPFMIDNIRKREGETTAMEVLDVLRQIRQTYPEIRMILTGSIGLHHVLSALKKGGYANAPVNDMAPADIGPIEPDDGAALAQALLNGEEIGAVDMHATAVAVTDLAGNVPYYIHHLVRRLKFSGRSADHETIESILVEQLRDPNDPWELRHYRERISTYYGDDERLVLAVLDSVAASLVSVPFDTIFNEAKAAVSFQDREHLRDLLTLLQRDHYVRRNRNGDFEFTSPIVRRWWCLDRDL